MNRIALLLAAAVALSPAFALAGLPEDAFLAKLPGIWKGRGVLTGAESGTVDCTLTVRQRKVGVNYSVKCDVPEFGQQSFSGIISYNDAEARYEAHSPSGDVTVGTKKGGNIIFTAKMKGIAEGTSVLSLSTSRIIVDTTVRRPGGTADINSHIELKR